MANYYISRDGRQLGPFSEQELKTMLATGQASFNDQACVAGSANWAPLSSLPGFTANPAGANPDSGVSTLIPYKNPPALIGYYLAVFSVIPCVGFFLSIPAVILGFIGLKKVKAMPGLKGTGHAWTAIILGFITMLLWGLLGAGAIIVPAMSKH